MIGDPKEKGFRCPHDIPNLWTPTVRIWKCDRPKVSNAILSCLEPAGASWGLPIGPPSIGGPAGHRCICSCIIIQLDPRLAYQASGGQVVIYECTYVSCALWILFFNEHWACSEKTLQGTVPCVVGAPRSRVSSSKREG